VSKTVGSILVAACVAVTVAKAEPEKQPNFDKYTYTIIDYRGVEPPVSERIQWKCWNDAAKASLSCYFVKGPLTGFRYVYRLKKYGEIDPSNVCDLMYLDFDKILYEDLLASRGRTNDPTECEAVTLSRLRLIRDRQGLAITLRQQAANCIGSEADAASEVRDAQDQIAFTERDIARHKQRCAADQAAEERERESVRAQADQEARSSFSGSVDYSSLASDGRISCFGGCQTNWVSPRGPASTITSRSWGDKVPPEQLTGVRSAQ
jgi:hypothetical protein